MGISQNFVAFNALHMVFSHLTLFYSVLMFLIFPSDQNDCLLIRKVFAHFFIYFLDIFSCFFCFWTWFPSLHYKHQHMYNLLESYQAAISYSKIRLLKVLVTPLTHFVTENEGYKMVLEDHIEVAVCSQPYAAGARRKRP